MDEVLLGMSIPKSSPKPICNERTCGSRNPMPYAAIPNHSQNFQEYLRTLGMSYWWVLFIYPSLLMRETLNLTGGIWEDLGNLGDITSYDITTDHPYIIQNITYTLGAFKPWAPFHSQSYLLGHDLITCFLGFFFWGGGKNLLWTPQSLTIQSKSCQ